MTTASILPATPSSSVILARDGDGDGDGDGRLEVLMVRRHRDTAFGSADAFPGGKLSADDAKVHAICGGVDAAEANRRLSVESGGLDYYSAAIRELFEETGVLLARREPPVRTGNPDELEPQRIELAAGTLSWPRFLRERNLRLAADELQYVSFWEAPLDVRPRFSTRFFVAARPPGQRVRHDGRELVDSRWMTPSGALVAGRDNRMNLPFPTMKNLELLSRFSSLAELMRWARQRWQNGIDRMRGAVIEEGGKTRIVLPGEPGYPEGEL